MRVAFGEYQLDTETRTLQREGRRIPVQSKAFDLLAYLIERRARVVSSDELLDALWPGLHVTPAALSTAVQKARQAVGDDGEHQTVLHTEHGKGFRFVAEVIDLSTPEADPSVPEADLSASETAQPTQEAAQTKPASFRTRIAAVAGIAALLLVVALIWLSQRQTTDQTPGHSLAVLPFVNMSADADQEYFADGISEELLNTLVRFEGLRVVGRTSSFSFKHSDADLKTIGERLGVDVILEGSVRKAGDRVRITAQLIDAKDGFHRWSETYDRELIDIFAIQTEIATAIADALRVSLSSEERERLATPPTENLEAYQAYLLGMQHVADWNTATLAESVDYFQQAIELDPGFALAYVGLAEGYLWQASISNLPRDEVRAKSEAAIDKAIELDDQLGEAYNALASLKHDRADYEGAEAGFRRALELNPNYATTYEWYGWLLREAGRFEEALALHRKALELDPLSASIIVNVGFDLSSLGRFDEALVQYEKALEINPDYLGASQVSDHYWSVEGQLDQAVVGYAKDLSLGASGPQFSAPLGSLFLDLGDPNEGEYWIKQSIEQGPERFSPNYAMQLLGVYQGDEATAWDYGRKAVELWWNPGKHDWPALKLLRDHELRAGRYPEARALYETSHPELLDREVPKVHNWNYKAAIDLALVLSRTGEQAQADLLLNRSFQYIQTVPRLGAAGYGIADVQIYALQGSKQMALSALRQAIDERWREGWWYFLKHDPNLESLHNEPEYRAMIEEIEADMAGQLAHVREMVRNGELPAILRDKMNLH
jgi:TolB-like protein/DNA-binding winged helix-turn-helix (wHTH) protein/Tfp pilus assembly protein PilF